MSRVVSSGEPFEKLLAVEYYDGPTAGIAFDAVGASVYFKLVAWDEDQWKRIFAVTEIKRELALQVWTCFENIETPRVPIWVPNRSTNVKAEEVVDQMLLSVAPAVESRESWYIYESHDVVTGHPRYAVLSERQTSKVISLMRATRVLKLSSRRMIETFLEEIETVDDGSLSSKPEE